MLNISIITRQSPADDGALRPRAASQQLGTCPCQLELGTLHTRLEPRERQGAQIAVQQPGPVGERRVAITDQAFEAHVVPGSGRVEQSINGGSGLAQLQALRCHDSR